MYRVIAAVAIVALAGFLAALALPFDPDERRPGTRLSGVMAEDQDPAWEDWQGRRKIWVQTGTLYLIPHSITAVGWLSGDELYVGCLACDGKYWPKNVARNPQVIIKVGDQLYRRVAQRLDDEARRALLAIPGSEPLPDMAVFRMARES